MRTSQGTSIYQALVQTGKWLGVDESKMLGLSMRGDPVEYPSIGRLKRYGDG